MAGTANNEQSADRALVLGASGFLGGHLVRRLVERGRTVRAFARPTSDCRATADLDIEWAYGDIGDQDSLAAAMRDVTTVYHCIVNPKPWLRDTRVFDEVNVKGLERALRAAEAAGVRNFILTSSVGTVAPNPDGVATEDDYFSREADLPAYLRSRVEGERRFLEFIADSEMCGVACCVGNTYGADDLLPTPQGKLVADASRGRMPFYWDAGAPSLGVADAAEGMRLAEHHGRSGQRYILADRWLDYRELFEIAARANGRRPRLIRVPRGLLYASAYAADWLSRPLGIQTQMTVDSIRCMLELADCSTRKAREELGWQPRPVARAIEEAVAYFNGTPARAVGAAG